MNMLTELLCKAYSPKLDRYVYGRPYEKHGICFMLGELGVRTLIDQRTLSMAIGKKDKNGYMLYENDIVRIKGKVDLHVIKRFEGDNWFKFVSLENNAKTIPFWQINEKEIELVDVDGR